MKNVKLMKFSMVLSVIVLAIVGLAILYSMISTHTGSTEQASATVLEYALYLGVAVVVAILATKLLSTNRLRKFAAFIYCAGIVSVLLLYTPLAISSYGTVRHIIFWIKPAYIMVLVHIVMLSVLAEKKENRLPHIWGLTIITMALVAYAGFSMLNIVVVAISFVASYIYGNNRRAHKVILVVIAILVAAFYVGCHLLLKDGISLQTLVNYRIERLIAWVNPELYPDSLGYEALQIKKVFEEMSLTGAGWCNGEFCSLFPPQVDYTYLIICEEFGWIGAGVVVAVMLFLCYQLFLAARLSYRNGSKIGTIISGGVLVHIALTSLVNILEMLSVIPYIGIVIPFLSAQRGDIVVLFLEITCVLVCLKSIDSKGVVVKGNTEIVKGNI